ncbi:MAG: quinol:cytochrome C oxidoreductase [Bacteroidia bacterium]|nr:quinol:cytochrome C oxidoreductase [Bacteroidia bacterium]MDW8334312.1 quinol:cytochrome C oxidoreductase [Bacteroidia bacterium]
MGHHKQILPEKERFEFTPDVRKPLAILMAVGAVFVLLGIILGAVGGGHDGHGGGHHGAAKSAVEYKMTSGFIAEDRPKQADGEQQSQTSPTAQPEAQTHASGGQASKTNGHQAKHGHGHAPKKPTGVVPPATEPNKAVQGIPEHLQHVHGSPVLTRLWANLILNGFFFMGVSLMAVMFITVSYASNAGWFVLFQRIPEAMGHFMPIGFAVLLIAFLGGGHGIYHWLDEEAVAKDPILQGKSAYLNAPFFLVREIAYFAIWFGTFLMLRNLSRKEDEVGGYQPYLKRVSIAAAFTLIAALTFSSAAWDWIMSIDAHWFSTMFGVYAFATCWVSMFALLTMAIVFLREKGYFANLNASHLHDLGKFMFAFSIFWTYIWFCQFLLIWYANIPEEGVYFVARLQNYPVTFFAAFILNFILPFFILLSKSNMRHTPTLVLVAGIIVAGHWLDVFNMVMPGTMKAAGGVGFMEIGMFLLFFGAFFYVTAYFLTKANLIPKNHPYLKESLLHEYH